MYFSYNFNSCCKRLCEEIGPNLKKDDSCELRQNFGHLHFINDLWYVPSRRAAGRVGRQKPRTLMSPCLASSRVIHLTNIDCYALSLSRVIHLTKINCYTLSLSLSRVIHLTKINCYTLSWSFSRVIHITKRKYYILSFVIVQGYPSDKDKLLCIVIVIVKDEKHKLNMYCYCHCKTPRSLTGVRKLKGDQSQHFVNRILPWLDPFLDP